ncbi:MAG: hypothetical protein MUC97_04985 [Bernardetiaceae bacterium]|jgi:hypothetical protein|nr:hypothetical protein [Bernardetiaceae bacterium]
MALTKVLITVKTYPTISTKYEELVCTAGFLENGSWIRIYPISFRKKSYEEQYKKYDWIELDLVKNEGDFRPESYRPRSHEGEIKITGHLDTKNNWVERKKVVLSGKIYTDLAALINEAKDKKICTSLAIFKPYKILDFTVEATDREWDKARLAKLEAERQQGNLFKQPENPFEVVKKLPYKFSYVFEDVQGKRSKLMIEDWEIGALYWNCLAAHKGNEKMAVVDVKRKYFDDFAKTKDLHFYLGTLYESHAKNYPNPFAIIGTFHPKIDIQPSLF